MEEWKCHSQGDGAQAERNWKIQDRHYRKRSVEHAPSLGVIRVEMTRQMIDWLLLSIKMYSSLLVPQTSTTFHAALVRVVVSGSLRSQIS
jgi:hypothetical protein